MYCNNANSFFKSKHNIGLFLYKEIIVIFNSSIDIDLCKIVIAFFFLILEYNIFFLTGRVWKIVFPEQDTYIYNNQEGERTVVTILRRVQEGRAYLGIDFWYSHFYLVGEYGLPDFYKVTVSFLNIILFSVQSHCIY